MGKNIIMDPPKIEIMLRISMERMALGSIKLG